jgi:pimeloyl-ACP methyl ester carboxylesterase
MTATSLADWRAEGDLVRLAVAGRPVTVFRRSAGPSTGEVWTLLHGWPTSSWDWAAITPTIERSHRTLIPDLPGVGEAPKGDGIDFSIDALAETVVALWRHERVSATRLVAHDVGATVAQELVARELEDRLEVDILSVTWLNGALYPDLHGPSRSQLPFDLATDSAVPAVIDADVYCAGLTAVHHPTHQPTPHTLSQHWTAFGGNNCTRAIPCFLRFVHERQERAERLVRAIETTTVPQRFIWGDGDPIAGRAQSERIQDRLGPRVDLVSFADCSHYPHAERPIDVAQEMLRPWDDVLRRSWRATELVGQGSI